MIRVAERLENLQPEAGNKGQQEQREAMTNSPKSSRASTGASSNWLETTQNGWSRSALTPQEAERALAEWFGEAHPRQYPLGGGAPVCWLVTGGRGSGKTRLGAEWVNGLVRGLPPFARDRQQYGNFALVGETLGDVREVMIDGPSGILAVSGRDRPRYEATRRRLVWTNGAVAHVFSSEDPESLRGPQFDAAWCDELGKWKNAEACWDMLQFGLRLGESPCRSSPRRRGRPG